MNADNVATDKTGAPRAFLSSISVSLSIIGVIMGSASAISFIQTISSISLTGFASDLLAFYRNLLNPLYQLLDQVWHLPAFSVDLIALYTVLLGIALRGEWRSIRLLHRYGWGQTPENSMDKKRIWEMRLKFLSTWVAVITLWAVLSLRPLRRLYSSRMNMRGPLKVYPKILNITHTAFRQKRIAELGDFEKSIVVPMTKAYMSQNSKLIGDLFRFISIPIAVVLFYIINFSSQ